MALAAEGYRRAKKLRPHLFIAAWNPGFGAEPDGVFSGLMKDGTFDLAMFETCARSPARPFRSLARLARVPGRLLTSCPRRRRQTRTTPPT
eukprot:COSAG04_NODE_2205_length_4530_cov_1.886958_6_plen_91_part_00